MTVLATPDSFSLKDWLRPGDAIIWSQACGEPQTLVEALIATGPDVPGLSAFAATSFSGLLDAAAAEHLTIRSMGAMGALRKLSAAGKLDIISVHLSRIAPMIETGTLPCDVAFVQVSPANENGEHSYGLTCDFIQSAVKKARIVIAEVNDKIPFTHGNETLKAEDISCAVLVSRPPVEVPSAAITDTDEKIAALAANYIEDGATLQIGIGGVPDAILRLLTDRRDLGVHSGMIGDGVVDLIEAGVITNTRKPFDQGISIAGALIGSHRLFAFADNNPAIGLRPSSWTHDPQVLSRLPGYVTINGALEVDLTGQVNAESSGERYLGGTGGQVDFVRAGLSSEGGHSIIALPATARGGTLSRIAPALTGPVTTARSDVDIIITEFGAAELQGLSFTERARALCEIAHPEFREDLERTAGEIAKRGF